MLTGSHLSSQQCSTRYTRFTCNLSNTSRLQSLLFVLTSPFRVLLHCPAFCPWIETFISTETDWNNVGVPNIDVESFLGPISFETFWISVNCNFAGAKNPLSIMRNLMSWSLGRPKFYFRHFFSNLSQFADSPEWVENPMSCSNKFRAWPSIKWRSEKHLIPSRNSWRGLGWIRRGGGALIGGCDPVAVNC